MAFEFVLVSDDNREKIFNFIQSECKESAVYYCNNTNWIHGVYDNESDIFITALRERDKFKGVYILINGNGVCFQIIAHGERYILEMSDELKDYKEIIVCGLKLYNDQLIAKKFKDSLFLEEKDYLAICEVMQERTKPNVVMSENQEKSIVGKEYREVVEKILAHEDWVSQEGRDQMSLYYQKAGRLCFRGMDDLYTDISFEVIKKGYMNSLFTCGYIWHFLRGYLEQCKQTFTDDRKDELKPIIDYVIQNMRSIDFMDIQVVRKELELLIYGYISGFEFVLTTDELRRKMLNHLYTKGLLIKDKMNWVTGVYNKEAEIFITQIYREKPGREIFDEKQRFIAIKDDGAMFLINAVHKYEDMNFEVIVPKEYEELTNVIKEGIELYQQDSEYRRGLSDEEMQQVRAILDRMNKLVDKL